jgi:hypothetical protein
VEIIDALEKLGFTIWQPVLLLVIFYLRQEVRVLVGRLASVKIGDKELAFHQDTSVADLKTIKDQLTKQPNETAKAIDLINEKIDSKLIAALCSIRRETRYLWPAIQRLAKDEESKAQIQQGTLDKIRSNLKALEDAGLLTYDIEYIGPPQYGILELRVNKLDAGIGSLIAEAEKR